ncbi:unnamed protein product, partial [Citrullus colocynthis]
METPLSAKNLTSLIAKPNNETNQVEVGPTDGLKGAKGRTNPNGLGPTTCFKGPLIGSIV